MKAREMFEKLGYRFKIDKFNNIAFDSWGCIFVFDFKEKEILLNQGYGFHGIEMDELKAIYKQMEELGWIEE